MDMNELYRVEDIVYKELKTVTDNGKFRSREEIDNVYKLIDVLKDIKCLVDEEDDYSYRGRKRDSMGRYSSRRNREFASRLEALMDSAPDDATRTAIQSMIDGMD